MCRKCASARPKRHARLSAMAAPDDSQSRRGQRDEKIRLGGMALLNGVLVHGPNAWACAVRTPDGELKVASEYKRLRANQVRPPLLRGPARLAEAFAVIPEVRRKLPEARLPFQRGSVLGTMLVTAVAVRGVKGSRSLTPFARELIGGLLSDL